MDDAQAAHDIRCQLAAVFTERLGTFYRSLSVTPPYDSVEKAKTALRERLAGLSLSQLQTLHTDGLAAGHVFREIMTSSGLAKKQRGIIQAVLRKDPGRLPPECEPLANAYRHP